MVSPDAATNRPAPIVELVALGVVVEEQETQPIPIKQAMIVLRRSFILVPLVTLSGGRSGPIVLE